MIIGKTETHTTGFIGKESCLGKIRDMWTNEGTFHVTYPGCTGTQSAVHSSWLLPQEPIISLPWHGTSSTAQGCLTEHDIASVCVCQCVCCKGTQTSSYHHLLQTANPQGPCQYSCFILLTCCIYCRKQTAFSHGCCRHHGIYQRYKVCLICC